MTRPLDDQAITRLFQQGFRLTPAEEEALWRRFTSDKLREHQAWASYQAAMTRLPELLRHLLAGPSKPSLWELLGVQVRPSGTRINLFGLVQMGT